MVTSLFRRVFPRQKPIIGMVHVFKGEQSAQIDQALQDLERLQPLVDGVIVENYDWGHLDTMRARAETIEILTEITRAVVRNANIPVGLNVLPNDYPISIRLADDLGCRFVQLDHVTGTFVGCLSVEPELLHAVRRAHPSVSVLGGIHPKYYELVDPTTPIAGSARTAKELADAVVVTGEYTGGETSFDDLRAVKDAVEDHPVLIGSGLTPKNARIQLAIADGSIVGSAFKRRGVIPGEPVDIDLVKHLMDEVATLR